MLTEEGLAVALGLVAAVVVVLWPVGAGAGATAVLLAAVTGVAVVAALAARLGHPAVVAVVVVGTVGVVVVLAGADAIDSLRGPLGYANATAAWYATGVGAACLVVVTVDEAPARVAALVAGVALSGLCLAADTTVAAMVSVATLAVTGLATWRPRTSGALVALCALAAVTAPAATVAIGVEVARTGSTVVAGLLDPTRPRVWGEAVDLVAAEPWRGHGADAFARLAPSAADPDQAWAHQELLELAAEHGLAVPIAVVVALGCVFLALARRRSPVAAVGAVTLAGAVVTASVDYVWHAGAVPLSVAAVVGAVLGAAGTTGPDVTARGRGGASGTR